MLTRFGVDALQPGHTCSAAALRATYAKNARLTVPAVDIAVGSDAMMMLALQQSRQAPQRLRKTRTDSQAIHLGSQYLVHESFRDSSFGQILLLKSVCWLDIQTGFHVSHVFHSSHPVMVNNILSC